MANEWNISYPVDHTLISDIPTEIRKLKDSCKDQLDHEHETPVDGDATGSEHSSGSGVAYEGTSTPTTRPGGASLADNAIDRGRLWIDGNLTQIPLKRWNGSAFVTVGISPSAYAGEESVIFPNGLIMKMGSASVIAAGSTVTFGAAFPTAVISATGGLDSSNTDKTGHVYDSSTTILKLKHNVGATTTMHWMAIGY